MASDLLTVAEVKESVQTGLSDAALGRIVDAEDAYLRRMLGEHDPATTMFYETDRGGDGFRGWSSDRDLTRQRIWLPRPASSISTVEDRYLFDSVWRVLEEETYYLSNGGRAVNSGYYKPFRTLVRVAFTPVSENAQRTQALIDLVRLETQDTGLESERDDIYTYKAKDKIKARREIITPLKHGYRGWYDGPR